MNKANFTMTADRFVNKNRFSKLFMLTFIPNTATLNGEPVEFTFDKSRNTAQLNTQAPLQTNDQIEFTDHTDQPDSR